MPRFQKAEKKSTRLRLIEFGIFLSGLSIFAQLYLFQPLLPIISGHFGASMGFSSFLVSASTVGMALGLLFFAFNADDYQRKNVMVFSLLSSAFLTIISSWIPSLLLLIVIGLLKGFVISGVSAVALAYLTEEVSISVLGMAMSLYLSGNIVGGMSGRVIASLLTSAFGWRNAVLLIGVESLVLALLFWKVLPESRFFEPQKVTFSSKIMQMKAFLFDTYMLRLYFIAALLMGTFVSVYNYLAFRLESAAFSLSHYIIAFIFLMYIFGIAGTMLAGKLTDKFRPKMILMSSILLMFVGVAMLFSKTLAIVIAGVGVLTLFFFSAHTIASRMVALHANSGKSSATSIYWLFYYVGSSVLGSGTGYLLHSTSWTGFIIFLLAAVSISLLLTVPGRKKTAMKNLADKLGFPYE